MTSTLKTNQRQSNGGDSPTSPSGFQVDTCFNDNGQHYGNENGQHCHVEQSTTPKGINNVFPDINAVAHFKTSPEMFDFAKKYDTGVTLLHSHHGHSKLLYTDDFSKSSPVKDDDLSHDLSHAVPCSWYANEGDWFPYEWTNEPKFEASKPTVPTEALQALIKNCGFLLGITARPVRSYLEQDDGAGGHTYIQHASPQVSANQNAKRTTLTVTCLGQSEDIHDDCMSWCDAQDGSHYYVHG